MDENLKTILQIRRAGQVIVYDVGTNFNKSVNKIHTRTHEALILHS